MVQNKYTVKKAQLLGMRSRQEDALSASPNAVYAQRGLLLVLADGMGGMANGHVFSQLVTEEMQKTFLKLDPAKPMDDTLMACFEEAQKKAAALNDDNDEEGGTTLIAVLIRGKKCAGDSRLALVRNGGLIWLNRPQVMGTRLDENVALGYLSKEDVEGSALRDAVTAFVGSSAAISCDACPRPFTLVPGDRIALMSDGITGALDDQTLLSLLMAPKETAAEDVIQAVQSINNPRQDNSSILLAVVE